ncbi:hypothetical protein IMZ48_03425, partial [Candidatus Bathyarchaeota archaeon]|nr:hypothetical protein [Candidatus Bathyarchaeota archaeon]
MSSFYLPTNLLAWTTQKDFEKAQDKFDEYIHSNDKNIPKPVDFYSPYNLLEWDRKDFRRAQEEFAEKLVKEKKSMKEMDKRQKNTTNFRRRYSEIKEQLSTWEDTQMAQKEAAKLEEKQPRDSGKKQRRDRISAIPGNAEAGRARVREPEKDFAETRGSDPYRGEHKGMEVADMVRGEPKARGIKRRMGAADLREPQRLETPTRAREPEKDFAETRAADPYRGEPKVRETRVADLERGEPKVKEAKRVRGLSEPPRLETETRVEPKARELKRRGAVVDLSEPPRLETPTRVKKDFAEKFAEKQQPFDHPEAKVEETKRGRGLGEPPRLETPIRISEPEKNLAEKQRRTDGLEGKAKKPNILDARLEMLNTSEARLEKLNTGRGIGEPPRLETPTRVRELEKDSAEKQWRIKGLEAEVEKLKTVEKDSAEKQRHIKCLEAETEDSAKKQRRIRGLEAEVEKLKTGRGLSEPPRLENSTVTKNTMNTQGQDVDSHTHDLSSRLGFFSPLMTLLAWTPSDLENAQTKIAEELEQEKDRLREAHKGQKASDFEERVFT